MDKQNKTKVFSAVGNKVGAAQINSPFSSNKNETKRLEIAPPDPDLRLPKEPDPAPRRFEDLFPNITPTQKGFTMRTHNKTKVFSAVGNKVGAAQINSPFSSSKNEKKRNFKTNLERQPYVETVPVCTNTFSQHIHNLQQLGLTMDEQNKTKAFSAIGNKVGAAQINSTFSSNKTEKKRLEIAPLDPDLRLPKEPDPAPR